MFAVYDILVSFTENKGAIDMMQKDHIEHYLLLSDCPYEFVAFRGGIWFDKLPLSINAKKDYIFYGLSLYSLLLREYLLENNFSSNVWIVPQEKESAFLGRYGFVKNKEFLEVNRDKEIWITSSVTETEEMWLNGKKTKDAYDFSKTISSYYSEQMKLYKDIHLGEKCFIVATGPSINAGDLNQLYKSSYKCFGVNRIYLAFQETKWRPDYLVVADDKLLNEYYDEIKSCGAGTVFICDQVEKIARQAKDDGVIIFHDHVRGTYFEKPKFSEEIEWGVYSGATVVYTCIQLAVYMGFKEIYLIGTDHNYKTNQEDQTNHFHKDYYKGKIVPDKYVKEKTELAYIAAREYADTHGIKIYNATRGGKLEIFERMSFDEVFKNEDNLKGCEI